MRFELVIILITLFVVANIYTEGKYMKKLLSYKKYYQMAGVAFLGFMLIWLFKKNPNSAKQIISTSNEYIKYLPIDQNTSRVISPILDFTSKHSFSGGDSAYIEDDYYPVAKNNYESRIRDSGKKTTTKRSVSETKKKFVSARQNWKCARCNNQLNAYFEVDHKIPLKNGGSNHVDNLESLCPNCHREKTAMDNMAL